MIWAGVKARDSYFKVLRVGRTMQERTMKRIKIRLKVEACKNISLISKILYLLLKRKQDYY